MKEHPHRDLSTALRSGRDDKGEGFPVTRAFLARNTVHFILTASGNRFARPSQDLESGQNGGGESLGAAGAAHVAGQRLLFDVDLLQRRLYAIGGFGLVNIAQHQDG